MRKRSLLPLLLKIFVLSWLLVGCAPSPEPSTQTPTPTGGPVFTESTPVIIHPPLFAVNSVSWSSDAKHVAIANGDGVFQVWDAASGRLISTHYDNDRSRFVTVLGWTVDSKGVVSTSRYGNAVQVWDAATGKTLFTFNNPDRSNALFAALSHNGLYVATGSGSILQTWNTSTGKLVSMVDTKTDRIYGLEWSPDDSRLATFNARKSTTGGPDYSLAQVWRVTTGTLACVYHKTSTSPIYSLAWSPDGARLASISGTGLSGDPVLAQEWDATTCAPLVSLQGVPGQADTISWSPDGAHIVSWQNYLVQPPAFQSGRNAQVWDAATGKLVFVTADQGVTSIAWSPDGRRIALAGQQMKARVLDSSSGQTLLSYQGSDNQHIVTWSPGGRFLATAGDEGTTIWEASADHRVTSIAARHQRESAVTWSPDGKQIAAEDGATFDIGLWDTNSGANTGDLSVYHEAMLFFSYRNTAALTWSPDGKHIAQAVFPPLSDIRVSVWGNSPTMCGLDDGCPVSGGSHLAAITSLTWSPNSKLIASGSLDKTVVVYDVANQKSLLVYQGHTGAVTTVAWSPDGKYIASASTDRTIHIWNAASGKDVLILSGHSAAVTSVAWSPDGRRIVSGSDDGTVRIWDAIHGTLILTYRGHKGAVNAVAWSPRGDLIASAGADTTVQVWNANTAGAVLVYRGHSDAVLAVTWSPDSRRIASASADGTVQIW